MKNRIQPLLRRAATRTRKRAPATAVSKVVVRLRLRPGSKWDVAVDTEIKKLVYLIMLNLRRNWKQVI